MIDQLPDISYFVVMGLVTIGWLALILFPRQPWANFWLSCLIIPLLLSFIYIFFLLTFWFRPPVSTSQPAASFLQFLTLKGVYTMFGSNGLLLAAWINIVAMDLVVGSWMARKAAQIRMPYVYLVPCLVATFVFAGIGFALFTTIATIGGGWPQIARFEGQPPTNTAPVAVRPSVGNPTLS